MTPSPFPPQLREGEFERLASMLQQEAGIHLGPHKHELLRSRLTRRLRALGLATFSDYAGFAEQHRDERLEMIDCVLTNETRFFREPHQFDFLEREVLPRWKTEAASGHRGRRVRVWSAGCSTGQESVSIAMCLLANLEGWSIDILATDLSLRALRVAIAGLWPVEKADEVPERFRKRFMLRGKGSQAGWMRATDEVRALTRFQRVNLAEALPEIGAFDLIFCRNVLIYFEAEARKRAITRMVSRLSPNGHFFVGHAESLVNDSSGLRAVAASVYTRAGTDARAKGDSRGR